MLFRTPLLTSRDRATLAEIDHLRARLHHQLRRSPENWTDGLRAFLTADAVAASNAIEGVTVATNDVRDLMAGERDVEVSEDERQETLAHIQALRYVQNLGDAEDFRYGKGLLNALHWMLQGHRNSVHKPAGQWRRRPAYVTDVDDPSIAAYTAPPPEEVPHLMTELVDWLNAPDGSHPLVRAAMAHLHLLSIRPWADGNGPMARTLQTLVIARDSVPAPEFSSIEAWLGRSRNLWRYHDELRGRGETYQPHLDVSRWIRFNLLACHQQAQYVQHRFDRWAGTWSALSEFALRRGLDARAVSALHEVALAQRLRRTHYERVEDLSPQQAQRDLRDLVARELLTPVGNTRARSYTAGPEFPGEVLGLAMKPATLRDPYGDTGDAVDPWPVARVQEHVSH